MNDDVKKEYDCLNCKYRPYDEYFCGCCMMRVLDEFEQLKRAKLLSGNPQIGTKEMKK